MNAQDSNDESLLAERNDSSRFKFKLDEFQQRAINYLQEGKSVVVCAPTGAGKTAIAEYAVAIAIESDKRCYYTTPLKALSNQKFHDFKLAYGEDNVGLLTGDISINREAPIVVMTTEVFRNMLYGTIFGEIRQNLRNVSYVVLDECHYMNDAERGTVWEESIIYAPKGLQLIALSATIANAEDLTSWIDETHGPTALIASDYRPVPLRFYYFAGRKLYSLLDANKNMHTSLRGRFTKAKNGRGQKHGPGGQAGHPADLIANLAAQQMLPAIYFVFSRRGCEQAMRHCSELPLLTKKEALAIKEQVDAYFETYPHSGLTEHAHLPYLLNGLAVHHAGMLPSWKALVEKLFQQGLIKVVFATETLAAGINMPARTTVISSLGKRADEGHRSLKASEFLQMSGRAGRRGMDDVGHVVIVHHPFESADDAARLAIAPPDPLASRFTPSYGMVLNLLERHTIDQAKELIEASFGQYLINQTLTPHFEERMQTETKLEQLQKSQPKQEKQIVKTIEKIKFLDRHIQRETSKYWRSFQALTNILSLAGYLDANKPTKLGHLAQAIRGTNELFLSEVCISGLLENLHADELAAILTALVTEENRYDERMRNVYDASTQIGYALSNLGKIARRINKLQKDFFVDIPVQFASTFCEVTQKWAQGSSWEDVSSIAKVDEGDIVRVLRRTLDLCRQIQRAPSISEKLVSLCREAERLIARDEIKEDV